MVQRVSRTVQRVSGMVQRVSRMVKKGVQNGTEGVQNGTECIQNGTKKSVQNGKKGVQNGTEGVQNGSKGVQNGNVTKSIQTGTKNISIHARVQLFVCASFVARPDTSCTAYIQCIEQLFIFRLVALALGVLSELSGRRPLLGVVARRRTCLIEFGRGKLCS